ENRAQPARRSSRCAEKRGLGWRKNKSAPPPDRESRAAGPTSAARAICEARLRTGGARKIPRVTDARAAARFRRDAGLVPRGFRFSLANIVVVMINRRGLPVCRRCVHLLVAIGMPQEAIAFRYRATTGTIGSGKSYS